MRTITLILVTLMTLPCFAAKRPGELGGKPKGVSRVAELGKQMEGFNGFLSESTSLRAQIKTPEGMKENEAEAFMAKMNDLKKAFESDPARFSEREYSAKLDIMIEAYSKALGSRSNLVSMLEATQDAQAKKNIESIIQLLDNGPKILEAKISEKGEAGVSDGLITLTYDTVGKSINKSEMTPKEILELKKLLEEPFKNERWTLEDIAGCR